MKKINLLVLLLPTFLLLTACINKTGDVFTLSDGQVIEGELESIGNGRICLSSVSTEVPIAARVWSIDGSTFEGELSYSSGIFSTNSNSLVYDSLYRVLWNETEVINQTLEIDASSGWTPTDINLEKGDIVSVTASGTVVTETGTSTPDGQDKFSSTIALVPGATSGQLVLLVGDESLPIAAGSNWVGEAPSDGLLQLAVNVPSESSSSARGVYLVSVVSGSGGTKPGDITLFPAR